MKSAIFFGLAIAFFSFYLGFNTYNYMYNVDNLYESNKFKKELLIHYEKSINLSNKIMDKHNLFDEDDSDTMSEYLNELNTLDSLYNTQL